MGDDRARRTRQLQAVAALLAVATWTAILIGRPLGANDQLSSVLGGYLALGSVAVGAVTGFRWLFPPAEPLDLNVLTDDLAATLTRQWKDEATKRALDSPHILPLVWRARTDRVEPATASVVLPSTVLSSSTQLPAVAGGRQGPSLPGRSETTAPGADLEVSGPGPQERPLELVPWPGGPADEPDGATPGGTPGGAGDGRLDGRFEEAVRDLAAYYRGIEGGRLVVLGDPGSGKSVVAILLTLGLLASRGPAAAVPVLLNVSSWDPLTQALDTWIVASIAQSHYDNRAQIPNALWRERRLLPVLDGLDEIPEASRRKAVAAINEVLGSYGPVVVTCRAVEYRDVIAGGSPSLHRGSVVQIEPVRIDDLVAYFQAVRWPEDVNWTPVYDYLRTHPGRPLTAALGTPLMVSLVRRNYQRLGGAPAQLLDEVRFPSRHAVEDHVLGQVVAAAYAPDRLVSGVPLQPPGRWRADQAGRWLTYLAHHLHDHGERDLAWWQLSDRLLSRWAAPVVGLVLGVFVTLVTTAGTWWIKPDDEFNEWTLSSALAAGAAVGLPFWLLAMLAWFAVPGRQPGRLTLARHGAASRFRGGFLTGGALAGFPVALALSAIAVGLSLDGDGWTFGSGHFYLLAVATGLALMAVVAVAMGVHAVLEAPPERSARATAQLFLRQDRWSSLAGACCAGLTVALLLLPAVLLAMGLVQVATGWPGSPGGWATVREHPGQFPDWTPASQVGVLLMVWLLFALLLLLVRAWPRFVVVRAHQAALRRLPLRLMRFLADAHDRGVLRESAGRYQFAHVRLQEHLADTRPMDGQQEQVRLAERTVRRQRTAAVVVTVAVLLATAAVWSAPKDMAAVTLDPPAGGAVGVSALDYEPVTDVLAIAYDSGRLAIWSRPGGPDSTTRVVLLPGGCTEEYGSALRALAVQPNEVVGVCPDDDRIEVWRRSSPAAAWKTVRPPGLHFLTDSISVQRIALDRAGHTLAVLGYEGAVAVWSEGARRPIRLSSTNADGELVITGRRRPLTTTQSQSANDQSQQYSRRDDGLLTLSPDGRYLAVRLPTWVDDDDDVIENRGIFVWDLKRPKVAPREVEVSPDAVSGISFSADSAQVILCQQGRRLTHRVSALPVGSELPARIGSLPVLEGLPDVSTECLSGVPRLFAKATGEAVSVWPVAGTGTRPAQPVALRGHTSWVSRLTAFRSPGDDRLYLVSGSNDGTVRLWDVSRLPW
jgi:WD40 repeat protein